jgi:hypothetical protein
LPTIIPKVICRLECRSITFLSLAKIYKDKNRPGLT